MSLELRDYDYALPRELIARYPLQKRDESRMMVIDRVTGRIEHRRFADFPSFLRPGDLTILNDTRVIPVRAFSDDGRIEFLFLEHRGGTSWKCMVKPGRKMRVGAVVSVGGVRGIVNEVCEDGARSLEFEAPVDLHTYGQMPLPPYIDRLSEPSDHERYQTVYASAPGAVAAPTAGLHFTPEILAKVTHAFVTLHVGAGTFKPVQAERITDHRMHPEQFIISAETSIAVQRARRIIAVGTTTVRVLESCMKRDEEIRPQERSTDIFIHPPFEFKIVDVLLTNFHLPKSTLLMLVSAFAGRELVLRAYDDAILHRYRFYSYGDCMLIV